MSDHEPFPGLHQMTPAPKPPAQPSPVLPPADQLGGPMPGSQPPGSAPGASPTPAFDAAFAQMNADGVAPPGGVAPELWQDFQFVHNNKPYRCQAFINGNNEISIALAKWEGGAWVKSTSALKGHILGALIVQKGLAVQPMQDGVDTAMEDADKALEAKEPATGGVVEGAGGALVGEQGPEAIVPPKQPVKG